MHSGLSHTVVNLVIEADPGAGDEMYYLYKAPQAMTVVAAYAIAEQSQNAGTATTLQLENWGTAGTAIKASGGTVVTALGGTASASRLTARTPASGSVVDANDYIDSGEWLVLRYGEEGSGWISGDRLTYQVHLLPGVAG